MKVLVVTQYFWPEAFRVNDLVSELRVRGHDISVLTGQPNYPDGEFFHGYGGWRARHDDWGGIPLIRVPIVPRGAARGLRLVANYLSFAISATLIGVWRLRGTRPDVILVYQPSPLTVAVPGIALGRLLRVPVALWVQDLWPDTLLALRPVRLRAARAALRSGCEALHRRLDRLLVQSRAFVHPLMEQGVAPDRIRYLPNWAEALYGAAADADDRPADLPDGFTVMFAGNLGGSQGLGVIVDAAEMSRDVPDLHWVVLGDGREADSLAAQVRESGVTDRVHLLGRRPTEAMSRYFAAADALLVTLRQDPVYEMTIPSKIQSYLAAGRPIVASLNGEGARVISESQAGLVAPAGDASRLAAAVRQMHALPPSERQEMGLRGSSYYAREFDREALVQRLEVELDELIAAAR